MQNLCVQLDVHLELGQNDGQHDFQGKEAKVDNDRAQKVLPVEQTLSVGRIGAAQGHQNVDDKEYLHEFVHVYQAMVP